LGAQDFQAIFEEQFRELEVFVLQHLHQPVQMAHQNLAQFKRENCQVTETLAYRQAPVLALLQIFDCENGQDFLFCGNALVRILTIRVFYGG